MEIYTISLDNVTPVKLVTAKATYGIGFLTYFVGGFCALFGIPYNMYSNKIKKAETLAMQELERSVESIGADGVMDVRCQIDGLSFLVVGTAYKWSAEEKAKREAKAKAKRESEEIAKKQEENKLLDGDFIDVTCPKCGEMLSFLKIETNGMCPYCDTEFKIK